MRPRTVVVYAGPSISADQVRAVLPQARLQPPAARGDLLAGDWHPGDTAVLIDGYFRERRSVGHKEILWLLGQGVDVIGAASMGALRAVELAPYGMRGVGIVYRMFASGEVDGDDEVGVLHGPAEMGYRVLTPALVSLRYGCQQGAGTGQIPAAAGQRIVAAAKAMPFTNRTWPDLEQALDEPDRHCLRTLREMIGAGDWDIKRLDAVSALRAAASETVASETAGTGDGPAGRAATPSPAPTIQGGGRQGQNSRHEYAPGRWMSDLDVLNAARLFSDDYPALHDSVLTGLLEELAAARGMTAEAYARARLGADARSPLPDSLAPWLTGTELASLTPAQRLITVMVRVWPHWQSPDWRPAVLARIRASGRWDQWTDLVVRADQAAEQAGSRLVVPVPAACGMLFLRHWRQPGTSAEIEMARRGFLDPASLGGAVRRFFAFDVQRQRGRRGAAAC
jgi:hypothetical protein